jgi:cytochrome c oxidase assembly protein subunit 11
MKLSATPYKAKAEDITVHRKFRVQFMAQVQDDMPWEFAAEKTHMVVNAGETALAFYKVINQSDKPISGIAIY